MARLAHRCSPVYRPLGHLVLYHVDTLGCGRLTYRALANKLLGRLSWSAKHVSRIFPVFASNYKDMEAQGTKLTILSITPTVLLMIFRRQLVRSVYPWCFCKHQVLIWTVSFQVIVGYLSNDNCRLCPVCILIGCPSGYQLDSLDHVLGHGSFTRHSASNVYRVAFP